MYPIGTAEKVVISPKTVFIKSLKNIINLSRTRLNAGVTTGHFDDNIGRRE